MEEGYMNPFVEMGASLAELVIKGTASAVNKKIRAAKEIKDSEKLRIMYDELINEVLQEREEAVRIAQVYKAELDRIEISDKDIEHLHNTVSRVLEIIKAIQLAGTLGKPESEREKIEIQVQGYEQIKELISVDTLKSMQLLGFNYKAAIATVYKGNIIKNLIMDCQSYTKYRPNETTGGIFVSWRRKEELPTGA